MAAGAREGGDEQVIAVLRELGIPDEAIERAVLRGDPEGAIFDAVLLPAIAERTVSHADVEAAGGLSLSEIAALVEAFGFPAPDPAAPTLTPQEADALIELGQNSDVWPAEFRNRGARVIGRHLARIAHAQVQDVRAHITPGSKADAESRLAALRALQSTFSRLLPLSEPFVLGAYRRWIEHELGQAAIDQAESTVPHGQLPGAADVAIVFCDLKDFTAYADLGGDAAAIAAIEHFTDVVMRERGEQLRLIKSLGDGFMLCYGDVHQAVSATARIVEVMRHTDGPGVHASIHRGVAVARHGDYFGSAVNLAARLLAAAGRDELVATSAVARATEASFAWVSSGVLDIRGVAEPIEIFRLARAEIPPPTTTT